MTRHYSTQNFFRYIPNNLLARYFHERQLLLDIDFSAMKENNPQELFTAWQTLPIIDQNTIDSQFQDIFNLSDEKGYLAILDEAYWHLDEKPEELQSFIAKLSKLPNHYQRAMITFLDHNIFWQGASRFHHADSLSFWRKRKNIPSVTAQTDTTSTRLLSEKICKYFQQKDGRGRNCIVEVYRRGDLDYFFAYPEDHSQQSTEWVENQLGSRPHNPPFEIIYVYSEKEGRLDLNFRGPKKCVEILQHLFAQAILQLDELPPDPKDDRVYDLNHLLKSSFEFNYDLESGIKKVALRKIRLTSRLIKGNRITLEADSSEDAYAIYNLLENINEAMPLDLFNVTHVEIATQIQIYSAKPLKIIPIKITYPNSCSLKYDEIDLMLRDMLIASGIEPKDPTKQTENVLEPVE